MANKNAIINFMSKKASYLPNKLMELYFRYEDVQMINDTWTDSDASIVSNELINVLSKYLENNDDKTFNDVNTCPFCILAEHKCNKCGYFKIHGCCLNPRSTYEIIIENLYPDGHKLGIMDYIINKHGSVAIKELLQIVTLTTRLNIIEK